MHTFGYSYLTIYIMTEKKYRNISLVINAISFLLATIYLNSQERLDISNILLIDALIIFSLIFGIHYLYNFIVKKIYPDFIKELELPYKDERVSLLRGKAAAKTLEILACGATLALLLLSLYNNELHKYLSIIIVTSVLVYFILYKYYERTQG